ncbi:shikimate kinase [Nonomuraea sp. NPDC050310]|uniref:shikimate kinase n=1 Tax=unclassified Nonomuraea TaxID=2593643 RepID=UPI0033E9B28A
MSKNKPVVVIGLMGSGKTTVSTLLARALDLPLSDSDPWLRDHHRATAAELAAGQDPSVLHAREAAHVLEALRRPQVIAAAASVVEDPGVRQALHDSGAFVAWLDAPDAVLRERMKSGTHRPGFDPAVMRARRQPYFERVADVKVDVGSKTPEQAAEQILQALVSDSPKPGITE